MSVRVRFAPSPTGYLHIGNARAALINWLFAKSRGGEFILRQDDTDLERSKQEYADAVISDLKWLGLDHDIFFKQSDRFDRYNEVRDELIKKGRIYPCFETPEELDYKRKRLLAKGLPPIYDRAALSLTSEEIETLLQEGKKPHWRFKLNPGVIAWDDHVRGRVEFKGEDLSDPVLIRADGAYLYTLTSVIDDFDYKITHIIRGEDHVTNTATQIQIFEALNGGTPFAIDFAHTTLLLGEDGSPLSKRLGSLSLHSLRDLGIEPMAINCLLARLGTSLPIEPKLTLEELADGFGLNIFSRTPPRFSENDLKTLNHKLYHLMPFQNIQDTLKKIGILKISEPIWTLLHDNISDLFELKAWEDILFGTITKKHDIDQNYLETAFLNLPKEPWDESTWKIWTDVLKELTGKKGKELFMPLRQTLTGMDHGPEMKEIILLMGYNLVCTRLKSLITINE
ncbi:MAG: glutamate--tRNA ligase [Proteobacteria bacterium]|nr:glutamate--tRNA ligase [Pseudomonadota bacterium]